VDPSVHEISEEVSMLVEETSPYAPCTWHKRIDKDAEITYPEWGVIHQYVDWAARASPSPTLFHTHLALAAVAWEVSRRGWKGDLFRTTGALGAPWELRHWAFAVAGPGIGKSYAADMLERFIEDFMGAFHNQGKSEPDEAPIVHVEGRSTSAGLFDVLNEKCWDETRRLTPGIILSTEASAPFAGGGDFPEILCELYDCRPKVERQIAHLRAEAKKSGERYRGAVEEARMSAVFMTTPSGIEKIGRVLGTHIIEGGLYTRCNFVYPEVDASAYFGLTFARHETHRRDTLKAWVEWAKWLDGMDASGAPKVVQFPERINKYMIAQFRALLWQDERDMALDGSAMRVLIRARIVASLFALSRGDWIVNDDDADRAFNLVVDAHRALERLLPQANVSAALDATTISKSVSTIATRVRAVISRAGDAGCSHSELLRKSHLASQVVQDAIRELLDRGEVRQEVTRVASGPGRPVTRYYHVSAQEVADQEAANTAIAVTKSQRRAASAPGN